MSDKLIKLISIEDAAQRCGFDPIKFRELLARPFTDSRRPKSLVIYDENYLQIADVDRYVKRSRERQHQSAIVTDSQFFAAMDKTKYLNDSGKKKAMLIISWFAGLRVGEVAQLKISNLLDHDGSIKETSLLYRHMTKTNTARVIFFADKEITTYVLPYIKRRLLDGANIDDYLFLTPRKRQKYTAVNLATYIKRIYMAIGLGHLSSHSGRAATAKRWLNKGETIKFVSTVLGHVSTNTTLIYQRVDANEIVAKMRARDDG